MGEGGEGERGREEKGGRERSSPLGTLRFIQKHSCACAERRRKEEGGNLLAGWKHVSLFLLSFFFSSPLLDRFFSPSFLIATHHRYFVSSFFPRRQPRAEETRLGEKWRARESVLFVCRPRREVIVATFVITNHEFVLKI